MSHESDRWLISGPLRQRMTEVARELRGTPTASEAILWEALRGKRLDGVKFRRQQPIGPFVTDFYAASARLVVEVDGTVHDGQPEIDRERQLLIESLGLRFARISTEMIENGLSDALGLIREALATAYPPSVPSPLSPLVGERGTGRTRDARPGDAEGLPRSSPFPPRWGKGGAGDRGRADAT